MPGCTQKGTIDPEGNRVGVFGYPKDLNLPQEWLVKIWQDVAHFKLTEATKVHVCSLHFHPSDVKKGIEDKKCLYVQELVPQGFLSKLCLASEEI